MFRFNIGDVICHRRYDYRGVIIMIDCECTAPDEWYENNETQPDRRQPWYRVLVDGGRETYVAEENLTRDTCGRRIEHPLVDRVFPTFYDGRYYEDGFN